MKLLKKIKNLAPIRWVRHTIDRLHNSSKWFIRMWNNYDWDYYFLFEMMVMKLKDMRYQLDVVDADFVDLRHQPVKGGTKPGDEDYEEQDCLAGLDKVIEIGERILKDDYTHYPEKLENFMETRGIFEFGFPNNELRDMFIKACQDAELEKKKDIKEFFETIRTEHENWWS